MNPTHMPHLTLNLMGFRTQVRTGQFSFSSFLFRCSGHWGKWKGEVVDGSRVTGEGEIASLASGFAGREWVSEHVSTGSILIASKFLGLHFAHVLFPLQEDLLTFLITDHHQSFSRIFPEPGTGVINKYH